LSKSKPDSLWGGLHLPGVSYDVLHWRGSM